MRSFSICKSDKDENKKAYDLIVAHKAEIETAIGEELIWDPGAIRNYQKLL